MNEKKEQPDMSAWYSTYGLLTSERILERFNIHLPHDELIKSVKDPLSAYFQLLRVPMKNVFNGIIMQQAHDYQIYAQKLFVDYLLSGEDAKEKESIGAETRENVEMQRVKLIETGDEFRKVREAHMVLIAESQSTLVDISQDIHALIQLINNAPQKFEQSIADYVERSDEINRNLRSYRGQFYDLILRTMELLRLLTDYHIDEAKVAKNRITLEFDALI